MRSAQQMTDSGDLLAALLAAEAADRQRIERERIKREIAAAEARHAAAETKAAEIWAAQEAAQERRRRALAALGRIALLPDRHAAALLRIVGLTSSLALLEQTLRTAPVTATESPLEAQLREALAALTAIAPPRSECTETGAHLVRGDEQVIRAEAEMSAEAYCSLGCGNVAPWVASERMCPRWHRRRLRREALRAQAYYDVALRMARPESQYVSAYTLGHWRQRKANNLEWATGMCVVIGEQVVPLTTIQANARKAKRAQLYAFVRAMEWVGQQLDMTPFFVTFTLPGDWHSYSVGERAKDGSYPHQRVNRDWTPAHGPQAQKDELNRRWGLLRSNLAKIPSLRAYFGQLGPEPHMEGTAHAHVILWLPTRFERRGQSRATRYLLLRLLKTIAPGRESDLEVIDKKKGAAPASYVMQYVMKSLDDPEVDPPTGEAPDGEEHLVGEASERYRAWASARQMRRMRTLGLHGSVRIWQRLWTSDPDPDPDDPHAERLPECAQRVCRLMQAARAAGEAAEQAKADGNYAAVALQKHEQARATAHALAAAGAWPSAINERLAEVLEDDAIRPDEALRLCNEETTTAYGRPTRRPEAFALKRRVQDRDERGRPRGRARWEEIPGTRVPLKRNPDARLCPKDEVEADLDSLLTTAANSLKKKTVTVVATCPRLSDDGCSWYDDEHAKVVENLIAERHDNPRWHEWCERMRSRVANLGGAPPPTAGPLPRRSTPTMIAAYDLAA